MSKKLKFWTLNFASNEVFCKPKGHHNVKLYRFWVLEAFTDIRKTWFKSGQSIFCNLGCYGLVIKAHWHSVSCRDPTPLISALGQKLIAQTQWLTLGEWDYLLDNSQKLVMGSQTADKKIAGIKSK